MKTNTNYRLYMPGLSTIMTETPCLSCCRIQPIQAHKPPPICVTAIQWSQNHQMPIEIIDMAFDTNYCGQYASHQRPLWKIPDLWQSHEVDYNAADLFHLQSIPYINTIRGEHHLYCSPNQQCCQGWTHGFVSIICQWTSNSSRSTLSILSHGHWVQASGPFNLCNICLVRIQPIQCIKTNSDWNSNRHQQESYI